ncbi:MAG TPA: hypothetical protein VHE09_15285 [Rhizomicrobium sp.]|jgi:hypothetical protein|nr:hypothetical protein [Rhizomicrobium sp.]
MRSVAFPFGKGWHYANVDEIIAVKYIGAGQSFIYLTGGIELECSEDTFNVIKRIEAALSK